MDQLIIATKNLGKMKDFKTLFEGKGIEVLSLLDLPEDIDVEETGTTFSENAILKAEAVSKKFNKIVIADDSGLSVDKLGGNPGVYSARYAGENKNDQENLKKVLRELQGIPENERSAHFHCALAIAIPGQETKVVDGTCEGRITEEPIGENGFGYDPIFYIEQKQKTMAQLTKEEKSEISHRANAMKKLESLLESVLQK